MSKIELTGQLHDDLHNIFVRVLRHANRVAKRGGWDGTGDPKKSLSDRVGPLLEDKTAPGFDAGIACCLDLIPRERQGLAATLHANYSPEAIMQARQEITLLETCEGGGKDTDVCWWLYACSFCTESQTAEGFVKAVAEFEQNVDNRATIALEEYRKMCTRFEIIDGIAWVRKDGGAQGSYLAGCELAVQPMFGTFFLSTYHESLGIPEDFPHTERYDDEGRPQFGRVAKSDTFPGLPNFIKEPTLAGLLRMVDIAREEIENG